MGIKEAFIGGFSRAKFFTSKHSPEICMVAGTVELVLTVVSACKATVKFQTVLENHNARLAALDSVKEKIEKGEELDADEAEVQDIKSARMSVYAGTIVDGLKCYGPTILLGVGTALTYYAGFRVLNKRFIAVSGVAAKLLKENRESERRCEERHGTEVLKDIKGVGNEDTIIETHKDEETGEEVVDGISHSELGDVFSIWFDAEHPDYRKLPGANKAMLEKRLYTCQRRLEIEGHLFYNEALRIFGYEGKDLKEAGQIYGWVYYKDPEEARKHGAANVISAGIAPRGINKDFYNGLVNECLLMFNVDPEPIIGRCGFGTKRDKVVPITC